MFQNDLWSAAPVPQSLSVSTGYVPENDEYYLAFSLGYSKDNQTSKDTYFILDVQMDELDVVPYLVHTAHRYFWQAPRGPLVRREVTKHLKSYREASVGQPALVNGFRAVDFG